MNFDSITSTTSTSLLYYYVCACQILDQPGTSDEKEVGVIVVFTVPTNKTYQCDYNDTVTKISECNIPFPDPVDLSAVSTETAELNNLKGLFTTALDMLLAKIAESKVSGEKPHVIDTGDVCVSGAVTDPNDMKGAQNNGCASVAWPSDLGKVAVLLRLTCCCYLRYLPTAYD